MDQRFYASEISHSTLILTDQEAKHCAQVLRKKVGDEIAVLDGRGTLYRCSIRSLKKSQVECDVFDKQFFEQEEQLTLAVAPPKSRERLEWMVEKVVEIGIKKLILFTSQNSERSRINLERLHKKMLSATKQSLRYYIPELEEQDFNNLLSSPIENRFIAHCKPELKQSATTSPKDVLVLIGPEGDFTDLEISQATKANFKALDLGNYRLRTETAALVATALFQRS